MKRLLEALLAVAFLGLLVVAVTGQYFSYQLPPGERAITFVVVGFITLFLALGNLGLPPEKT